MIEECDVEVLESTDIKLLAAFLDEQCAIDIFEFCGVNFEIATGQTTVEEFAEKSLARKQARAEKNNG